MDIGNKTKHIIIKIKKGINITIKCEIITPVNRLNLLIGATIIACKVIQYFSEVNCADISEITFSNKITL